MTLQLSLPFFFQSEQGWGKEIKRLLITPQMAETLRSILAEVKEQGTPSRPPTWMSRGPSTQAIFCCLPRAFSGSWIRKSVYGTQISTQVWDIGFARGSLIHYAIIPAQLPFFLYSFGKIFLVCGYIVYMIYFSSRAIEGKKIPSTGLLPKCLLRLKP